MKISQTDILLIPGYGDTLPGHWLMRWRDKMPTAREVKQDDVHNPSKDAWMTNLLAEIEASTRPVVLVAHSLGCILVAHGAESLKGKIAGAYLVAPSDWDREGLIDGFDGGDFVPIPKNTLPFPAHVVGSRNDPYCDHQRSQEMAKDWGAHFQDAGDAGHITLESGHGPWPEGMMSFAGFLSKLDG
ncbi:RBBP9/YdeN family alpha/beta hydrolase [Cohaesibacter intestini]|uniref:RBBP9/YdeN family alpha/beta hydrolase n=1 Tax=Cohaesibacter intestini TaxID=2211145 RepID=UPI000DE9A1C6|nr:alpha/beta fold hydrolase [Cohaesibacter intestini]